MKNFKRKALNTSKFKRKSLKEDMPTQDTSTMEPNLSDGRDGIEDLNSPPPEAQEEDPETEDKPTEAEEKNPIIKIQQMSQVSPEFTQRITKAVTDISEDVRQLMADNAFNIGMYSLISDVIPNAPGELPSNICCSASLYESMTVAISENYLDENNATKESLNPEGLTRLELGHLLNSLAQAYMKDSQVALLSDLDSFKYAHTSDIARINQDKQRKLAFYVEDAQTARAECFAECFAALSGGGAVYTLDVLSKVFPAVMKQIKDIMDSIKTGTKMGGEEQ